MISVMLGAAVALWLKLVAMSVQDMREAAAEPLKALQGGAFSGACRDTASLAASKDTSESPVGNAALLRRGSNAGTRCEQPALDETAVKFDFRRPRVHAALPCRLPLRCLC